MYRISPKMLPPPLFSLVLNREGAQYFRLASPPIYASCMYISCILVAIHYEMLILSLSRWLIAVGRASITNVNRGRIINGNLPL